MGHHQDMAKPWKCKEARIRRLQQILGTKRTSSTAGSLDDPKNTTRVDESGKHNTFAELRTELSKVKCDLQKLMEDMALAKQSSQRLQLDAKDKAMDIEKRVHAQLEDFRRSMKSEFTTLRKENEKALVATRELLTRDFSGHSPSFKTKSPVAATNSRCILLIILLRTSQLLGQAMLADGIRKDVVPQASSQRLERTVSTVRGWLRESPTDYDSSEHEQRPDSQLTNVPTSFLMSSIKDEAKLYSKHHRKAQKSNLRSDAAASEKQRINKEPPPALRILQKRNMRMADLVGSESDED